LGVERVPRRARRLVEPGQHQPHVDEVELRAAQLVRAQARALDRQRVVECVCLLARRGLTLHVRGAHPQVRGQGCERAPDARCEGASRRPKCLHMNYPDEPTMTTLTIRMATPSDTTAVNRLAALDSSRAPQGP